MKNVFTKRWLVASLVRSLRTFSQGLVTLIGSDMINIIDLDWVKMLGIAATMAVVSMLTSIAGLPEVDNEGN